ncbi:MAG: signal peptidase I [Anaerolineae bacterium]
MAQTNGEIIPDERGEGVRGDEARGSENGTGGIETPAAPAASTWTRFAQDTLETLLLAAVLFVAVRLTLQNTRVDGHSMEPTLHDGQYLMVNKLAYRFGEPHRGDIIVFRSPQDGDKALIKRVIAVPGDEVQIADGAVFINGAAISEPYLSPEATMVGSWGPLTLGEGEYLALGDNRNNSNDSRSFGPVTDSMIIGKAWFSIWPLTYGLGIDHYDTSSLSAQTVRP